MFSRFEKIALFLLAACGLLLASLFWHRAFPTVAFKIDLTESSAVAQGKSILEKMGYSLSGYRSAADFGEDTDNKYYLEREYGVPKLEQTVSGGLNLWYWSVRFFKPEQQEELNIDLDPSGRIVGYRHLVEEAHSAPFLTNEQARAKAEAFLTQYISSKPLSKLKLVEQSTLQKPHRTDYKFTWEQPDLKVGDASYRLYLTVQGNEVGEYSESLKVPEAWLRRFQTDRESNQLLASIAGLSALVLLIGMIIIFIIRATQRRLHWKNAIPARWLILSGIVTLASAINLLPSVIYRYNTTQRWTSFLFKEFSSTVLETLCVVGLFYLITVIADAFYRERLNHRLPFSYLFGKGALSEPEVVRALGVGIAFACFSLGYACTFYVVAGHFGAWSPIEINYAKTLQGPIPWIDGMNVGLTAAWSEEMIFRVIGVFFFWKITRQRWLAIIWAGITWAFLHSTYPQMPSYIRGVELSVEGILWGVLMLRYGIIATLTAHFLYDCWLSSLVVFQSSHISYRLGALVVALWPVALWIIGLFRIRYGKKVAHPEFLEETISQNSEVEIPPPIFSFLFLQLNVRQKVLITVATLVFILVYPWNSIALTRHFGKVALSRQEIEKIADQTLVSRGQNPSRFQRITTLMSHPMDGEYLAGIKPLKEIVKLYSSEWPDLEWEVRYFRFLEKEGYHFTFDKHGNLISSTHTIPREAAGASLTRDQALEVAQKALQQNKVNFLNEKLVEDQLEKQEHRNDYSFEWERLNWNWGDAKLRTAITVQGNEPVGFQRYIKIPEAWYRAKEKSGWKEALLTQLSQWVSSAISVAAFIFFVVLLRRKKVQWKLAVKIAFFPTLLTSLQLLNKIPWFYSSYITTTPRLYYFLEEAGSDVLILITFWLGRAVQMGVVLALAQWAFGWSFSQLKFQRPDGKWIHDRLPNLLLLLFFSLALNEIIEVFRTKIDLLLSPWNALSFAVPSINETAPWLGKISQALQSSYTKVLNLAALFSVGAIVYRRSPFVLWMIVFIAPFYTALSQATVLKYFESVALSQLNLLGLLFLAWKVWRFDLPLIFLFYTVEELLKGIVLFLSKGGPAYQSQAVPLIIALLFLGFVALWIRPNHLDDHPLN